MGFDEQRTLASPTGAALNLHVRWPAGRTRAVVQVSHGLAEHAARYARFAEALAAAGFTTYAHDHRGHGLTRAPDAPPGRFATKDGVAKVIADVAAVHAAIAAEHKDVPVIAFGHSMGGLVALNFVLSPPDAIAGAAIWNANFTTGLPGHAARLALAWERFRLGSDVPSRILPGLTFRAWGRQAGDGRTPADWLSRDPAEVDKYIADPLCGWDASVSMWRDVFDMIFRGADDRNFAGVPRALPFHLVGGGHDPATSGGRAVRDLAGRLQRMGFSNLETTIYPQNRHETLNELDRETATADFIRWVENVMQRESRDRRAPAR